MTCKVPNLEQGEGEEGQEMESSRDCVKLKTRKGIVEIFKRKQRFNEQRFWR